MWKPENVIPVMPSVKIIGTETRSCSHSAVLSPVQTVPYLWVPGKNALDKTKGLSFPPSRFKSPSDVAIWK